MNKTDYLVAKGRIPDPNLGTMWIIKSTRVSVVMFELPIWEIREGCFRNTYNPETKEKKEVEFTTYFFKDDPFDISIDVDDKHEQFGFAVNLFRDKYEDALTKVFKSKDYRNSQAFVCFAELIGEKSSFGQHDFLNDKFDIVLFDISEHKHGLIVPKEFINDFGHTGIPRIVYTGNLNKELVQRVKANEFGLTEGLICKGVTQSKKGNNHLYYCKIKTDDWFQRLRTKSPELYALELKQAGLNEG
jgi:hypothetical protein